MPITQPTEVSKLKIDLINYRTIPQQDEAKAVHAMITINSEWFWALMESLLDDGYHPTENIIVLNNNGEMIVKEGNRRIGALKIIYGIIKNPAIELPEHIKQKMGSLPTTWKNDNLAVPCTIYDKAEADKVDKIITLTHGKGEKAGRDIWNAVARARHSRDKNGISEPGLDLLEKYIKQGSNITPQQAERWSGDYPLSILDEAIPKLAIRLNMQNSRDLANNYPNKNKTALDNIIRDIGLGNIDFKKVRDTENDFAEGYGIPLPTKKGEQSDGQDEPKNKKGRPKGSKQKAYATNDPKSVMHKLKYFKPLGNNREKLVVLLDEAKKLKLNKHPHAFCFVLRSMFEISAKAYYKDNNMPTTKTGGMDIQLVEMLREIVKRLTNNNQNKPMVKSLHGALTELGKPEGILSVTSMNQLIHNPKFTVDDSHISTLFHNIFPLLEEINK